MPTISSTKRGLPSAAARIRSRAPPADRCPRAGCRAVWWHLLRKWLEQDRGRVHLSATPPRTQLQQFGACDQRAAVRVSGPIREVLDEVEQERFRPVEIVDHTPEPAPGPGARRVLGPPTRCPRGPRARPSRAPRPVSRAIALGLVRPSRRRASSSRSRCGWSSVSAPPVACANDLRERVVGDAFSVGEAPSAQDAAPPGPTRNSRTSRDLPIPAGPSNVKRCEVRSFLDHSCSQCLTQDLQLFAPADHRRVEVPDMAGGVEQHLRSSR